MEKKCVYRVDSVSPKHAKLDEKKDWKHSIDELEEISNEAIKKAKIRKIDLSKVLPPNLFERVANIIEIPSEEKINESEEFYGKYEKKFREAVPEVKGDKKLLDDLVDRQIRYDVEEEFDLEIEEDFDAERPYTKAPNWMADYFRKPNQERIVWQTKLYASRQKFEEKSLFDQVEELTDLSARAFVKWLNELGQEKSDVNEEMVKKLFSIGLESRFSKALSFGNQMISAIPNMVAHLCSLPEAGQTHRYELAKKEEKEFRERPDKRVAFGQTLPAELAHRHQKFEMDEDVPEFFRNARSFKSIFDGITNLTSTQILVDHLNENPEFERPQYLVDSGMFEKKHSSADKAKNG